jgi:hypothetical protein
MDAAQEEQDRLIRNARALGYTNVRVIGHNSDGSEIIALHQPSRRGPPGRIWGTLVVKFYDDSEERHRDDPDFEDKSQHKSIVIQLLIRQFGRDREAVITNKGPEYHESEHKYRAYTLQECLKHVDHRLRILYIHRMYKEEGEGFCKRDLTEHHRRIHGLRKSEWVDSYDLLSTLCRAWAQRQEPVVLRDVNPSGWGRWCGEASARWNAGERPLLVTQEDTEPSPAPADEEPGVTSNENAYAHNRKMQQQEAAHPQGNSEPRSTRNPGGWGRDRKEVNARWTVLEGPLSFLFDTRGDAEPFLALARDDPANIVWVMAAMAAQNRESALQEIAPTHINGETSSTTSDDEDSNTDNVPAISE